MKFPVVAALVVLGLVMHSNGAKAQSSDEILRRLDLIEKKNATLEKENAELRVRMKRLEASKRDASKHETKQKHAVAAPVPATSSPALAAYAKASPVMDAAPMPSFSWTGCYIGAAAGGGAMSDQFTQWAGSGGPIAGGQLGCNYQTGMLVFGIEGDGYWSGIKNEIKASTNEPYSITETSKNKYDFDVAGRLGVVIDRTLIYGKAGWVWGEFNYNQRNSLGTIFNTGGMMNGLLLGLGFEYALMNNWAVRLEYDYLRLANQLNGSCIGCGPATSVNETVGAEKHLILLGLDYMFL
jgi:outer membrane immunogenic protein